MVTLGNRGWQANMGMQVNMDMRAKRDAQAKREVQVNMEVQANMEARGKADQGIRGFLWEEEGLGTVEIVLILAVLVGIALIFRQYIFGFIKEIMDNIMGGSVSEVLSNPLGQ